MILERKPFVYERIAADLRIRVASSHRPGDMLPSENVLAAEFAVQPQTVRQALGLLVQEGLICRYNGRGTVVVDRLATGECAIVVHPQLLGYHASPFFSLASTAIMKTVSARHPLWNVRMHVGKVATDREFPPTLDLLNPRVLTHLRGVFTFHPLYELETELLTAKVATVNLRDEGKYWVWFDYGTMFDASFAHLKLAGCRSAGVVWCNGMREDESKHPYVALIDNVLRSAVLQSRPEWVQPHFGEWAERAGYESLMRLWSGGSHPDGILVTDDVVCRGVLRAALHLGIDIPRQLRLVTHANRNIEIPYHKPVTRFEFDSDELVRQGVEMMEVLQSGLEPVRRTIRLPGRLVQGETT